jgi:hypothetical protein
MHHLSPIWQHMASRWHVCLPYGTHISHMVHAEGPHGSHTALSASYMVPHGSHLAYSNVNLQSYTESRVITHCTYVTQLRGVR